MTDEEVEASLNEQLMLAEHLLQYEAVLDLDQELTARGERKAAEVRAAAAAVCCLRAARGGLRRAEPLLSFATPCHPSARRSLHPRCAGGNAAVMTGRRAGGLTEQCATDSSL